ncbi:MAG: DUF1320 domain-containing protein [Rhodospirillales bacterium]|nr:DUF1320 domain-containing protein [Rhodospirillales bacterium]
MLYASVDDMIARFGQAEIIRLSTADGAEMVAVVPDPIVRALGESSALIDTYLRRRYRVPLDVAPHEVRRACQIMAYYDLSSGAQKQPSAQAAADRKEVLGWLAEIAAGTVLLDLEEVTVGDESYAATSSRDTIFQPTTLATTFGESGTSGSGGSFW